jgi:hypothetical protein
MAKLAGAGGQDAVDGLKSTLFDYAYNKAGGAVEALASKHSMTRCSVPWPQISPL